MRALAYAAIIGVGLLVAGAAAADPWSDPAGRFTLNVPHGWRVQVLSGSPNSFIKVGNAERECQFFALPNASTTSATPAGLRRGLQDNTHYGPDAWLQMGNTVQGIFPSASAHVVSNTRDDTGFWPVQRAEFASPGNIGNPPLPVSAVHAGLTARPGVDIMGFCYTVSDPAYPTADNPALFDPVLRSMGTANDAALQAAAEAAATPAPAPTPPPAPAPAHH